MVNKMKGIHLLLLLLFISITGCVEATAPSKGTSKVVKYHDTRRYWTSVDLNGKTYISLNVLKDAVTEPVKLLFPKNKNLDEILSDITLYSPADDECRTDTNKLKFKLKFDDRNFVRLEVKAVSAARTIKAFIHEVCPGVDGLDAYASFIIDRQYRIIDGRERMCFLNGAPFHSNGATKNVMTLEVSGSHKCQVFMVLPAYMDVEDLPELPPDTREPVNATFAAQGEDFWWKNRNNQSLPDGLKFFFNFDHDVGINISQSTKAVPYFLRIGTGQPYPSLEFKFDPSCSSQQYDLFVNLRSGDDCRIKLNLTPNGIKITTKDGSPVEIKDPTKSPTLVLARGKSKFYAKAGSHLSFAAMDVCQIENSPDVPDDQFVLQLALSQGSAACKLAQVRLLAGDVKNKIEALLDPAKVAKLLALNENGTNTTISNSTASAARTSSIPKNENAGFPWFWILAVILGFFGIVAIVGTVVWCVRRRLQRKQKEQKKGPPPCSRIQRDPAPANRTTETAIPVEEPPPPKKQNKKNNKCKMDKKKEKSENGENKKGTEPEMLFLMRNKKTPPKKPAPPEKPAPPKTPIQDYRRRKEPTEDQRSVILSASNDPVVHTASTQNPTKETIQKVERPELKFREMYGPGGFVNMDIPFDYHENESDTFAFKRINFEAVQSARTPPMLQFLNFWSCIDKLCDPKRNAGVYVDSKTDGSNIFFLVRDCVAEEPIYFPFRSLSNRILEPLKQVSGDGEKKLFIIRVFILSYEPLTMEVHCRGECPRFLFYIFDCEVCPKIGKRIERNPIGEITREKWETFLCRVKRTPLNSHQFYSYNGDGSVSNADEINHMLIIRGDKQLDYLRECTRGCNFEDASHSNNFTIEAELPADPTIQTQNTQQPTLD